MATNKPALIQLCIQGDRDILIYIQNNPNILVVIKSPRPILRMYSTPRRHMATPAGHTCSNQTHSHQHRAHTNSDMREYPNIITQLAITIKLITSK